MGLTKLFNDILGVKYVESRTVTDRLYQMEQVDYEEPLALYRNDNALSIGFMVDSDIKDWDIDSGNAADVQNEFVALAVNEGPLFTLNQSIEMTDGGSYDIVIPAGMQAYLEVTRKTEKSLFPHRTTRNPTISTTIISTIWAVLTRMRSPL